MTQIIQSFLKLIYQSVERVNNKNNLRPWVEFRNNKRDVIFQLAVFQPGRSQTISLGDKHIDRLLEHGSPGVRRIIFNCQGEVFGVLGSVNTDIDDNISDEVNPDTDGRATGVLCGDGSGGIGSERVFGFGFIVSCWKG